MMNHEHYMQRAIELAKLAEGATSPNPIVGAVVVSSDGRIIGEGWHKRCGEPHAEVNAIASVVERDLLSSSTIYVTLEPCSHWGKTPPCADLIISTGLARVVVGTVDPNARVCGRGIGRIREAGIEVLVGVLERECQLINQPFFISHNQSRPYILLKWAQTSDGYLDIDRAVGTPTRWFTGWLNKLLVHRQRSVFDAIAVGTNTVEMDDPALTNREWFGSNPTRVTFDRSLRLSVDFRIFDNQAPTVLFTSLENRVEAEAKFADRPMVTVCAIDFGQPVPSQVVSVLSELKIQSLIVEGGARLLQSFIDCRLFDNVLVFRSGRSLSQIHSSSGSVGVLAPVLPDLGEVIERRAVLDCVVELR